MMMHSACIVLAFILQIYAEESKQFNLAVCFPKKHPALNLVLHEPRHGGIKSFLSPHHPLRLRGGAKNKKARPRSWKEHGEHHRRMRKESIKRNRGVTRPKHYTRSAIQSLEKYEDKLRLKEIEDKLAKKEKYKDELKDSVEHRLRKYYMAIVQQQDEERARKHPTLDDFSDPVERELEELRQKRGETRYLTDPDWREEHPSFWREVEKRTADDPDIDDPEKVWRDVYDEGNVWKAAAFNRRMADKVLDNGMGQRYIEGVGGVISGSGGGGGGGQLVAAAQGAERVGPTVYEEAPSSVEEELEAAAAQRRRAADRRRQRGRLRARETVRASPARERALA